MGTNSKLRLKSGYVIDNQIFCKVGIGSGTISRLTKSSNLLKFTQRGFEYGAVLDIV